jgi:hypothetical protein
VKPVQDKSVDEKIKEILEKLKIMFPGNKLIYNIIEGKDYIKLFIGPTLSHLSSNNAFLNQLHPLLKDINIEMEKKYPGEIEIFRLMIFTNQIFHIMVEDHIIKYNIEIYDNKNIRLFMKDLRLNYGDFGPKTKFAFLHYDPKIRFVKDFVENIQIKCFKISEIFKSKIDNITDTLSKDLIKFFENVSPIELQYFLCINEYLKS